MPWQGFCVHGTEDSDYGRKLAPKQPNFDWCIQQLDFASTEGEEYLCVAGCEEALTSHPLPHSNNMSYTSIFITDVNEFRETKNAT